MPARAGGMTDAAGGMIGAMNGVRGRRIAMRKGRATGMWTVPGQGAADRSMDIGDKGGSTRQCT